MKTIYKVTVRNAFGGVPIGANVEIVSDYQLKPSEDEFRAAIESKYGVDLRGIGGFWDCSVEIETLG